MNFIDIGEVSKRSGMRPSALRYYEDVGLISPASRNGLRRQFPPTVLLQLKLIAMGKAAGFSLAEIAAMLGADSKPDLPRALLRQRADDIDRKIRELTVLRDTLHHVADCRAASHMECPKFRRIVETAGKLSARRAKRSAPQRR